AFTKAVLAQADPDYTAELERQLADTGQARVWVPAATPLAAGWVPGADLRACNALPVLIIDGNGARNLAAAVAALVNDLGDAEIVVRQTVRSTPDPFEHYTVALLNRGVPSFAVETDGTLHTALMRSCTSWPSGTWIDEPRRTAPDGSNFQLQHWTHAFDYALTCGDGDWRHTRLPARSAQFSNPLLAITPRERHGALPPAGSLLRIEPADSVLLGALKAAGNPLAGGSARPVASRDVALRLVETTGAAARVALGSDLGTLRGFKQANLLEQAERRKRAIDLHGYQVATVLARLDVDQLRADSVEAAPESEPAQPLYARYWLHNRGPAPLGGLPAVAHLHPPQISVDAGADLREVTLRLTVASDCTDVALAGAVQVLGPDGWSVAPVGLPFTLEAGGHLETDVVVGIPGHAPAGRYPVRAQLRATGPDVPTAWRQVVEDVAFIDVDADARDVVYLVDGPADVTLGAGDAASLSVTIGSRACADLALEAHLISPWGTWEWMGPAALGADLPALGSAELAFDVSPPAWLDPGQWWALVRVGCAGRLIYSPAVKVTVT
ncbi:MAG: alpha-mannosidase, partial [Mycobacteriaceae bacterium]|nr:alpha-mannosidase [Mycobacteriaceae bacterium]